MQQTTQLQVSPPVGASVLRSAIRDSQQLTSPIGFLFLKLPPPPCAVLLVYVLYAYMYTYAHVKQTSAHTKSNKLIPIEQYPARSTLLLWENHQPTFFFPDQT